MGERTISITISVRFKNNADQDDFTKNTDSYIKYKEKLDEIEPLMSLYNNIVQILEKKDKDNVDYINYLSKVSKYIELVEEKQSQLVNSSVFFQILKKCVVATCTSEY